MREKTITVYKYSELSDKAKETAMYNFQQHEGYPWGDDALESLKKGIEHFGCSLSDYSIDWLEPYRNSVSIAYPHQDVEEKDLKEMIFGMGSYNPDTLKGLGDCVFTGYCADEGFADGVREAYIRNHKRNLKELLLAGVAEWEIACRKDAEWQMSEEAFIENADTNEWEFHEDGSMV